MSNCLHPDTSCQLLCPVINNFKHTHVHFIHFFSNNARFSYTSTVTRLHSCSGKNYAYASCASCFYIEINVSEHYQYKNITKSTSVS